MNRSVQQLTHRQRGFTLIELMISLALMVLLMLGVNFIFTAVGGATGSAQVLSKIGRDIQAAQNVMASDFNQIAMRDGPTFQITSIVRPAFMNKQDQLSDGDGFPETELLNPTDPSETPAIAAIPGNRAHRLDLLSFFARGNFHRQTGNDGEFISDMSSSEAWIWYGHLRVNAAGSFTSGQQDPGTPWSPAVAVAAPNPNSDNYFASQWILGRVPMLLVDKDEDTFASGDGTLNTSGGQIANNAPTPIVQGFIDRNWVANQGSVTTSLGPLYYQTGSAYSPDAPNPFNPRFGSSAVFGQSQSCRFDLAATTIDLYRNRLIQVLGEQAANPNFDWYSNRFARDDMRFQCNPFLIKPLTSAAYSQQRAVFLSSCTQFIVEYAGDFVYQDPTTGNVTNWFGNTTGAPSVPTTDGEIDYLPATTTAPFLPRQIRWYGMPRGTAGLAAVNALPNGDVAPLRDIIRSLPDGTAGALFERHVPTFSTDYASGAGRLEFQTNPDPANGGNTSYVCAWGPKDPVRPSLIRIVLVLDDPNGRLKNGMTFEYVYKVQ